MRLGRSLRSAVHLPVVIPAALLLIAGMIFLSGVHVRLGYRWVGGWHVKQMTGIALGLAAAVVVVLIPYKTLVGRAYLVYGAAILLLLLVLAAGTVRKDSRRWLNVLGFDFQPSEVMKLALILTLARFIRFRNSYKRFKGLGAPFLLTLIPMALILKQPDLGTALLCIPILFTMLFVAGARIRHLALIMVMGAGCIYPMYEWGLKDYQKRRIDGFLAQIPIVGRSKDADTKSADVRGMGYQVHQSKIAIGSGGIAGVGSDQAQSLRWVPERLNDFVFAVVANKAGLFGAFLVLALFVWLLVAILAVAMRHRDPAGRLICVGVFALFFFQAFINIGMTIGLMPITGMTLPLLSYGRSSVLVSILAVGLVCNVAARPSYEFGRGDFD